jgi:hypothetical protein
LKAGIKNEWKQYFIRGKRVKNNWQHCLLKIWSKYIMGDRL